MTAEQRRLEESRDRDSPLEALGPVPERARLGHGARGLQRRRHRLGVLPARPRALARLPLERGRPRRHLAIATRRICFALALWNGRDPILKERLFGLTGNEGNHGEDVKEYYFYLDSTPTHSYMKYLYKYPQAAYPYAQLRRGEPAPRQGQTREFELLDTGVFDEDRYFDVAGRVREGRRRRHPDPHHGRQSRTRAGALHLLPTLWFRNTWSWGASATRGPSLRSAEVDRHARRAATEPDVRHALAARATARAELLFTENETNNAPPVRRSPNAAPYVKDGINDFVVHGARDAVNPAQIGTKAAAHYPLDVDPAGSRRRVRLRLRPIDVPAADRRRRRDFDRVFDASAYARPTSSTPTVIPDDAVRRRDAT